MKVLFYNWAQFDDARMAGGGVTVHLRSVIEELLRRDGVEIWFLSGGKHYGVLDRRPRIVPTRNAYGDGRIKTFTLINSPIKAPAHDAFYSVGKWRTDQGSLKVLDAFLKRHGPFDALHIHNLEGVGSGILRLARGQAVRRLFYTFHNYMPVCPQIDLLHDARTPCEDYRDGYRCIGCLGHDNRMEDLIAWQRAGGVVDITKLTGHPLGGFLFDMLGAGIHVWRAGRNLVRDVVHGFRNGFHHWNLRQRKGYGRIHDWRAGKDTPALRVMNPDRRGVDAADFRAWRMENGAALAENMDGVFAVSDLARETAMRFLPPSVRIEVLPLPVDVETSLAERARLRARRQGRDGVTLSFVGYDIPSKGLPFLIEALADLDEPFLRENVDLLVVASLGPQRARQLRQLERVFRSVRIVPSYRRDQLEALSGLIDLNIVPSIWWETFNQVTVELAHLGVPSLVSSTVGAKQVIQDHDLFVFESGNAADLRAKLLPLIKDRSRRDRFFEGNLDVPTMKAHVDLLLARYSGKRG